LLLVLIGQLLLLWWWCVNTKIFAPRGRGIKHTNACRSGYEDPNQ